MTYRSDPQLVIGDSDKKKHPTIQEKFIKMTKKNKLLLALKKQFNLELC